MAKTSVKNIATFRLTDKSFIEGLIKEPVEEVVNPFGKGSSTDGFMGNIKPIVAKAKSGTVFHIVCKGVSHENEKLYSFYHHFEIFLRENLLYSKIVPEMEKLCKSSLPVPKMYGCLNDGLTDFIALEDLRPLGYQMPEHHEGLSLEETSMVLKKIGAFHANGYRLIQERGMDYFSGELSIFLAHHFGIRSDPSNSHFEFYGRICVDVFNVVRNRINGDELAAKVENICSTMIESIMIPWKVAKEGKYFSVVCHGDLWANNLLFKYSENSKQPLDVKFLDFQMCHVGSIYDDLYYFIYTSTTPQSRKIHLKTLLDIYYESFIQELQRTGTQIPPQFSREKFNEQFFQTILGALAYSIFAAPFHLGVFPAPPPKSEEATKNEKSSEENDDEYTVKIFPPREMLADFAAVLPIAFRNSDRAMNRVVDLVHEFSEMKAL